MMQITIPLTPETMIALSRSHFELEALCQHDEEALATMLGVLSTVRDIAQNRMTAVQRAMRAKGIPKVRSSSISYADAHPQDSLHALHLPEEIEYALGRSGLGIRTLSQLTQCSRRFLEEQLRDYEERASLINGMQHPVIPESDIAGWLDIVEAKLANRHLKLAA